MVLVRGGGQAQDNPMRLGKVARVAKEQEERDTAEDAGVRRQEENVDTQKVGTERSVAIAICAAKQGTTQLLVPMERRATRKGNGGRQAFWVASVEVQPELEIQQEGLSTPLWPNDITQSKAEGGRQSDDSEATKSSGCKHWVTQAPRSQHSSIVAIIYYGDETTRT